MVDRRVLRPSIRVGQLIEFRIERLTQKRNSVLALSCSMGADRPTDFYMIMAKPMSGSLRERQLPL
jgi:hypothetical protein